MISRNDVEQVLVALGENFIVDIPATHDGKGDYTLDYFELVTTLVNPPQGWVDEIVGYVNTKEYEVGSISPGGEPKPYVDPYTAGVYNR